MEIKRRPEQMLHKRYLKTKNEYDVTFEHADETASKVVLLCEANNWQPIPMRRRRKDGVFYTKLRLPADGRYQFRYFVDGERWANDEAADAYVPNEHGSENSVVATDAV
jgi:1,4-alpha-glucan branching enzyme